MQKAIAPVAPLHATFASIAGALDWRSNHGGWLFVADDRAGATWFDLSFTAGAVMRHPAARGNGRLV